MRQSENGNGILEILLFLPIAILLLSAGVDCALWLRERGASLSGGAPKAEASN